MTPRLFALLAAAAPVLGAAVVAPSPASALPVFDAAKYQQNLLAAARALEQINHQIASLQNEARMIQQQARQLERLDFSALARLDGNFRKVDQLLGQARARSTASRARCEGCFPGRRRGPHRARRGKPWQAGASMRPSMPCAARSPCRRR
jgi:P-type conjugative transfer protein TrbJ